MKWNGIFGDAVLIVLVGMVHVINVVAMSWCLLILYKKKLRHTAVDLHVRQPEINLNVGMPRISGSVDSDKLSSS